MTYLSLVIPVYNEEQSLPLLFDAIQTSIGSLKESWELIFVDDGSDDQSLQILQGLVRRDPQHVRVVVFRRNFGQTAAIAAGIDHSEGQIIVLLDADLQNDPADIPRAAAHQAPQSLGFSRQEHWSGLPCPPPGDLPDPGIRLGSPTLQADSLPSEP